MTYQSIYRYAVLVPVLAGFIVALLSPAFGYVWEEPALGAGFAWDWVNVPGVAPSNFRQLPGGCFEHMNDPVFLGGKVVCM